MFFLSRVPNGALVNRLWDERRKAFIERYGHPDPVVSDRTFVEKTFGSTDVDCDDSLASNIVSLALFDGNLRFFILCL